MAINYVHDTAIHIHNIAASCVFLLIAIIVIIRGKLREQVAQKGRRSRQIVIVSEQGILGFVLVKSHVDQFLQIILLNLAAHLWSIFLIGRWRLIGLVNHYRAGEACVGYMMWIIGCDRCCCWHRSLCVRVGGHACICRKRMSTCSAAAALCMRNIIRSRMMNWRRSISGSSGNSRRGLRNRRTI